MRKLFACLTVISALTAPAGHAAQDAQGSRPTFRSGVDLITVDVAVHDGRGQPVEDLRARDFTVKVDGQPRDVVSAELVKVDRTQPTALPAGPAGSLVTTNLTAANGRRVVIAVDQTLIVPGSITPLLRTASRFVDGLTPQDHAAFLAFPEPGPRMDFTTDRARLRKAMEGIVGQPQRSHEPAEISPLQLWEALEIAGKERTTNDISNPNGLGPVTRRVLDRGCMGMTFEELDQTEIVQCLVSVTNESVIMTTEARQNTNISLRRLESFLAELIPIEGPKSLILISAGLMLEDFTLLSDVIRLAADARTSITVVAVEPQRETEIRDLPNGQSSMTLQGRALELQGLETVADRTGGSFVRAIAGNGQGIFDRLASELSAWYVVAVRRQPGDPDRQRLGVEVKRRGVTVRSSRTFVATSAINASRPREEILRDALSSPMAIPGVPLRISTFAQRDATTGKYRLHVAAQIGQPGTPAGEFSVGYVVMNEENRVVASLGRRLGLTPGGANEPLHFDTALGIDPGAYALRFGVVDAEGRRGTVVHPVTLESLTHDDLKTSDLIIGNVPAEGEVLHPSVEPYVRTGRVAGYLELYLTDGDPGELAVSFEIAEGEATPPLTTQMLNIGAGSQPAWRAASGVVEAAVLPGRYLARATVRRGGRALRVLSRPFVLEPGDSSLPRPVERVRGVAVSPEMRRRAAAYVGTVVGGLSNIVAQEDFTLTGPNRRVTSDFWLVLYPGSDRDLLSFREVTHVNGAALPDRQERREELFLKPITLIRERVRQIAVAAEAHVPPAFNPILVLAFLQADFQARFELTVNDAGPDWPAAVKAVAFVETGRPTLLRAGPLGDLDVPARGTAWIEEGTGRILQTELQLGGGRSTMTVVTRFRLDQRLQIMVPELMRTENPDGVATYSNFRRFGVQTETAIAPEPR